MPIAFWLLTAFLLNILIGAAVCAFIDTEDEALRKWATSAPFPLSGIMPTLVMTFWPVVLFFWLKLPREMRRRRA